MSTVATAVTDLASLCAASGLGTADLVDTNEADLNDVFEEFGVSVSTKIKIKKELLASKKQNKKNKKKGDGMSAGLLAADHQQQTALPQRFQPLSSTPSEQQELEQQNQQLLADLEHTVGMAMFTGKGDKHVVMAQLKTFKDLIEDGLTSWMREEEAREGKR